MRAYFNAFLAYTLLSCFFSISIFANSPSKDNTQEMLTLADGYFSDGDYDAALKQYNKLQSAYKKENDAEMYAYVSYQIGLTYYHLEKYNKVDKNTLKALEFYLETEDEEGLQDCYLLLAMANEKMGNTVQAKEYEALYNSFSQGDQIKNLDQMNEKLMLKTKRILKDNKLKDLALQQAEDSLKIVEEQKRQKELEVEMLNKQKEIDRILQEAKDRENETKRKALEVEKKEAQAEAATQRLITYFLIFLSLIFIGFGIYVYRSYLQKKRDHEIIEAQNTKIVSSINYAKGIQSSMLPKEEELRKYLPDSFIFFKPLNLVSGDFYWFSETDRTSFNELQFSEDIEIEESGLDQKDLLISAVDCTGHGVPGAFVSMIGFNLLNTIVSRKITQPDEILNELNKGVRFALNQSKTNSRDGMDLALCKIVRKENKIVFSGAKNPLVYIQNEELFHIKGSTKAIGGLDLTGRKKKPRGYNLEEIEITAPTYCYIFSDGFQDQFGGQEEEEKKYMIKNLKKFFLSIHKEPYEKQKELLEKEFASWIGTKYKQIDDVLVIGFRIDPV